jgi:RNA polymerase sigma factor (TIGR02999 family)
MSTRAPDGAEAADALLPVVYRELRALAARRLSKLAPGQTLQPTALVHEAYLALVERGDPGWGGRAHFFAAAARAMHEVLIDRAPKNGAAKRNAGVRPAALDDALLDVIDGAAIGRSLGVPPEDVLAIAAALERLVEAHPRQGEVALCKSFAGLEDTEVAAHLGVTTRTVERDWRFARAFLAKELAR